jgi:hypothetical protein
MQTLCIGVDIAWWGGGKRKAFQTDHVWAGWVDAAGQISRLEHLPVDLKDSLGVFPQHPCGLYGKDPYGAALLDRLSKLSEKAEIWDDVIIAIDAPLESAVRPVARPRRPCYRRGETSGAQRRSCEHQLGDYLRSLNPIWAKDVNVQPGSPLFPRISGVVEGLKTIGYRLGASGRQKSTRSLVEIFPSASIGVLGASESYLNSDSTKVRRYKTVRHFYSIDDAYEIAREPIVGFKGLLGSQISQIADQVAITAAANLKWKDEHAARSKYFDDVVDAGIAFATGACLAIGKSFWIGDGSDGAILLPKVGDR